MGSAVKQLTELVAGLPASVASGQDLAEVMADLPEFAEALENAVKGLAEWWQDGNIPLPMVGESLFGMAGGAGAMKVAADAGWEAMEPFVRFWGV